MKNNDEFVEVGKKEEEKVVDFGETSDKDVEDEKIIELEDVVERADKEIPEIHEAKQHEDKDVIDEKIIELDDIFEISTKPVVSSHTGVQGTCETVRNLSDKHLKKIAESGGLISIAMFEPATCDSTVASSAKAIKYCIDLVGADYVALGSDFDGAIEIHTDVTGLPLYVDEMLKLGISEEDIRKVMGDNVKRFMLKNLPKQ